MPAAATPTASVYGVSRLPLGTPLGLGQLVAALSSRARPFLLAGRWGLPAEAPTTDRVLVAGYGPRWVRPRGEDDPLRWFGEVGAAAPVGDGEPLPAGVIGGGLVGWLGYDLGRSVERTLGPQPPRDGAGDAAPLAWYDDVLRRDPAGDWWVEALAPAGEETQAARRALARWQQLLASTPPAPAGSLGPLRVRAGGSTHTAAIEETLERIRAGELFQANICLRLDGELAGNVAGLVEQVLVQTDPWYGGWIDAGGGRAILSASPELFLRRRGQAVTTWPIKGTAPRAPGSTDPSADPAARALAASAKDRAEHVMIVDLMRNDLGRVCDYGTVRPEAEPQVQAHAGVWHLVSAVDGQLHAGLGDRALLRATFPPGSVTGAPKVQAQRVIAAVEGTGREAYTGAHGISSPISGLDLAVTIRTLEVRGAQAWLGVGGGIVADSDPAAELAEALGKAQGLLHAAGSSVDEGPAVDGSGLELVRQPIDTQPRTGGVPWLASGDVRPDPAAGLIETALVTGGRAPHLARHLTRLAASAAALGIMLPAELEEQIVDVMAASTLAEGRLRIELPADADEPPLIEVVEFPPVGLSGVTLAPIIVPGGLGPHKWRDRLLLAELQERVGATPLLLDADGTVLEAAWANVWWLDGERLCTPVLDGRQLPGVGRSVLLDAATVDGLEPVEVPPMTLTQIAGRPLLLTSSRGATAAHLVGADAALIDASVALAARVRRALAS